MNPGIRIVITVALAACGSAPPPPAVTTTSAESAPSPRQKDDGQMPLDLPNRLLRTEPGPVDPRVERDLDIAARGARERDRKISDTIVRAIVNDASLSPRAKHIDVTTHGRHVTLRGEVPSGQERQEIDAKARFTPDVLDVDDLIVVVP